MCLARLCILSFYNVFRLINSIYRSVRVFVCVCVFDVQYTCCWRISAVVVFKLFVLFYSRVLVLVLVCSSFHGVYLVNHFVACRTDLQFAESRSFVSSGLHQLK